MNEAQARPTAGGDLNSICSIAEALEKVRAPSRDTSQWFRGQLDSTWSLQPALQRNRGWIEREETIFKRFRQIAASRLTLTPHSAWEWLCLAQHYGVPSRLLDWSENPLVALYFAVEKDSSDDGPCDARLFSLDPSALNNSAMPGASLLLLGEDQFLDEYLPGAGITPSRRPLAVIAPQSFSRIAAQSGVFTLTHRNDPGTVDGSCPTAFRSWTIPLTAKASIREELNLIGMNEATVYPDLHFLGAQIREQYQQ